MHLASLISSLAVSLALLSGAVQALTPDQQKALDAHNQARNDPVLKQKRGPLSWDGGLEADAAAYAKVLAAKDGGLEHAQDRNNAGENLYMSFGGSGDNLFLDASKAFIDEKKLYVPACPPISMGSPAEQKAFMGYGHYTQCVWPGTQKVGMASAVSKSGKRYVVARYRPSGNMMGQSAC
ncbi:hypothetical protein RB595_001866 [Gaeumannomyces hyphopodioides]